MHLYGTMLPSGEEKRDCVFFAFKETNECVGVHKEEKMTMTILKEERVRVVDFKATCTSFH